MPSQVGSDAGRRVLVTAGTEHFQKLDNLDLLGVPGELARIVETFATLGYPRRPVTLDPDHTELKTLFAHAKEDSRAGDHVVAYYSGHGSRDEDEKRFYLLTCDSEQEKLDDTALPAEDLARALIKKSKASQILIILDCCYAAAGANEIEQIAGRLAAVGGEGPELFVIAAARTKQEADVGALSSALAEALANRTERLGGRVQPVLYLEAVMDAIQEYLEDKHPTQQARYQVNAKGSCRIFPNPRYRPELRPGVDLETQRAFTEHWVPRARGAELGVGGWYFTGREQALRELATWLQQTSSGGQARVVTGGPGCGKSAVLARIVTLSDPTYRQEVFKGPGAQSLDPATLPPESVVNVAVLARRKLVVDVVAQIAGALNLTARGPTALVEALAHRPDKTVIVVDALDEADEQAQIVSRVLRPIAGLAHIFLLVGTRPDSAEHGQRFRALGESAVEIDLDQPRYIGTDDVARYVERRLLATEEPDRATPYRQAPGTARVVAQAVAERAQNVFLVAHTAVIALLAKPSVVDVSEPGWIDHLPSGLDDAFTQFLRELDARTGAVSSAMARAVLLPLAFAEGDGLPWLNLWAAVATAISEVPVQDADIVRVREQAAAFIVEATENNRSVYRLYHERVAEHLRGSVNERLAHRHICEALRSQVPVALGTAEADWPRAHPYVLTHLLSHAFKAGELSEMVADGEFLSAAEPVRTLRVLSQSPDRLVQRAGASITLAFRNLRDQPAEDRLSYLEMAARQLGDDALADVWIQRGRSRRWSVPWTRWSAVAPHRVIPARGASLSVAVGAIESRPVIVSGGSDGTVRVWDLTSGLPRGEPLRGHVGWGVSVAVGTLEGRPVIVSGGSDGTVRVWDLTSGTPRGEPLRGHDGSVTSVVVGTLEGRPMIVSGGSDGTVRVWDLTSGGPRGEPLRGHDRRVISVAVGTLDEGPVIVSGDGDGTVRVWDLTSGAPRGEPWRGHDGGVTSVAVGTLEGQPVIVSGGDDGTLRVWDLTSGAPRGEPLRVDVGEVKSVAVGTLEGRPVIVSGGADEVQVWDLASGAPRGEPLRGHDGWVTSVAVGTLEGRPVIVSGGQDDTVRVWDLTSGAPRGEPLRGHDGRVTSVATGTLEGRPLIVSGGNDGTVRAWDLTSGTPRGEPLRGHDMGVTSVAVGTTLEGRPVIVSGGWDGTVRVRDLTSGAPRGEPLRSDDDWVLSVAVGTLEGHGVIVSGGSKRKDGVPDSDGTVRVWDLTSGAPRGEPLRGHDGAVNSVAMGALDGRPVIVSGGPDGTVRVWDLISGAPRGEPLRHDWGVTSVAMGTLEGLPVIVSGGSDGTVRVWDLTSDAPRGEPLRGSDGEVTSVAVGTLEGRPVIVSGGDDGTVRVWDRAGELLAVQSGSEIRALAWGDTGTLVVGCAHGLMAIRFEPQ